MGSHQIKIAKKNLNLSLRNFSPYPPIDSYENLVRELQEGVSLHIHFGLKKLST